MIRKIALFVFFLAVTSLHAENKTPFYQFTGQVTNMVNDKPIPYATITLQNDSAKQTKRISSDALGKFTLNIKEKRKYKLIVSAVGFSARTLPVEATAEKTDLGIINLNEGVTLKEVSVQIQKPLVKVDVDKITYSVEADPDSKTSNALEILRKVPLLNVDGEEKVTLSGQSNYKVLVNGKTNPLMSRNFTQVLRSLPANAIKDVEVITHPSSKYEAEGVGGIINIITVKKTLEGYNGSLNAGMNSHGNANATLYVAAKVNSKLSLSGSYCESKDQELESGSEGLSHNYLSPVYHNTTSLRHRESGGRSNSVSAEMSYEIDSVNLISLSFWRLTSAYNDSGYSLSDARDTSNVRTRFFENNSNGKSNNADMSGSIDYQKSFKNPDKTFTVSYIFNTNPYSYNNQSAINSQTAFNYTPYTQRSVVNNKNQEHSMQVDYVNPLTKMHKIECGIKGIYRGSANNSDYYRNDSLRINLNNDIDYDQYIVSAYGGYVFRLKKIVAKTGFRLESTWNDSYATSDTVTHFSNRFFNLVPYLTFSYQLKPNQTITASYRQGLQRPGIWDLNPYIDRRDPMNIKYGNPLLVSEISHSFKLSHELYSSLFFLSSTLNATIANNAIKTVMSMDTAGITTSTKQNIGKNQSFSYYGYASYNLGSKFSANTSLGANYVNYESYSNGYRQSNEGFSYNFSLGLSAALWKNARINANGGYSSSSYSLQSKMSANYYNSFSLSQSLFKQKLAITFAVSEPFRAKFTNYSDTKGNGYESHNESYSFARKFRLRAIYYFGKTNASVKKTKRKISNDDRKAVEGN